MKRPEGSLISYMSNMAKSRGGINLAQGIPGFNPPQELIRILKETADQPVHQYAPGTGDPELVSVILNHYHTVYPYTEDHLLVVNGATEAISLIYTYLRKKLGRSLRVAAPDPAYESYARLPGIFGDVFIPLTGNQWNEPSLRLRELEKLQPDIVFLNSPGNPVGTVLEKKTIQDWLSLSEKYGFYILFDAVYRDLYFGTRPYIPDDCCLPTLFYINGFSKLLSLTGWRIGYLLSHPSHQKELRSIHDYIGLSSPSLLQKAIARYLESYAYGKEYVSSIRTLLRKNYLLMKKELGTMGFVVPDLAGGYFLWADLPRGKGLEFAMKLYEKEKVAVVPGEHFSENARSCIRINMAREENEIREALHRIQSFIKSW